MSRRCWTCNSEHDLDEPCKQSPQARAERATGGAVGPLFGNTQAEPIEREAFPARFGGRCPNCGQEIEQGDMIIASHDYGYVHEECDE